MRSRCAPWVVLVVLVGLCARRSAAQELNGPCPTALVDVLFVLDHSGSISDNDAGPIPNWIAITDAIAEAVRVTAPYPGVSYAAIGYGSDARLEFNFDRYTETLELVVAFRSIENRGGNTNTTGRTVDLQLMQVSSVVVKTSCDKTKTNTETNIRVLPSGNMSKTQDLENLALAYRSSNLAQRRWTPQA